MKITPVLLFGLSGVLAPSVWATSVYRCQGPEDAVIFTDKPCEEGTLIKVVEPPLGGLNLWVPDIPPLPEKPAPVKTTPQPVYIVVEKEVPVYSPYDSNVWFPMHGHTHNHSLHEQRLPRPNNIRPESVPNTVPNTRPKPPQRTEVEFPLKRK